MLTACVCRPSLLRRRKKTRRRYFIGQTEMFGFFIGTDDWWLNAAIAIDAVEHSAIISPQNDFILNWARVVCCRVVMVTELKMHSTFRWTNRWIENEQTQLLDYIKRYIRHHRHQRRRAHTQRFRYAASANACLDNSNSHHTTTITRWPKMTWLCGFIASKFGINHNWRGKRVLCFCCRRVFVCFFRRIHVSLLISRGKRNGLCTEIARTFARRNSIKCVIACVGDQWKSFPPYAEQCDNYQFHSDSILYSIEMFLVCSIYDYLHKIRE